MKVSFSMSSVVGEVKAKKMCDLSVNQLRLGPEFVPLECTTSFSLIERMLKFARRCCRLPGGGFGKLLQIY